MRQIFGFLPVLAFFTAYKLAPSGFKPVVFASIFLVGVSVLTLVFAKLFSLKLTKMEKFSSYAIIVFGLLTIFFDEPSWIKFKITLIHLGFSGLLFYQYFRKRPKISLFFEGKIYMDDPHWLVITRRIAIMFAALAISNELVWHFATEQLWVYFKLAGIPLITLGFTMMQLPYILKHSSDIKE